MTDLIRLNAIKVDAICGVLSEEQTNKQPFEISLTLEADLSVAGKTDDLNDTIDYGQICDLVEQIAENEKLQLLERFCQHIADSVLASDSHIQAIEVSIKKMKPPVNANIGSAEVRIRRVR